MNQQLEQYHSQPHRRILLGQERPHCQRNENAPSKINQGITKITLQGNEITGAWIMSFCMTQWPILRLLYLSRNRIGDKGAKYLSQTQLPNLQCLDLGACQVGNSGVLHLSKARWPNFKTIYLNDNDIASDSLRWLVRGGLGKMVYMNLNQNQLWIEEMLNLVLCESKSIKRLELLDNVIDRQGKARLKKALVKKMGRVLINF